jgi:hypothetical protein
MRRVLATASGAALYRRTLGMNEPVFADTKFNRKFQSTPRPATTPSPFRRQA